MATRSFFIRVRGKVTGPFDIEQLRSFRARGTLRATHDVSEDNQYWFQASTLEEVFPVQDPPAPTLVESTAPTISDRSLPPAYEPSFLQPATPSTSPTAIPARPLHRRLLSPPMLIPGVAIILCLIAISSAGRHRFLNERQDREIAARERELQHKQHDLEAREQAVLVQQSAQTAGNRKLAQWEQENKEREAAVASAEAKWRASQLSLEQHEQDVAKREREVGKAKEAVQAKEKQLEHREHMLDGRDRELNKLRDELIKAQSEKKKGESRREDIRPDAEAEQRGKEMLSNASRKADLYRAFKLHGKRLEASNAREEGLVICWRIQRQFPSSELSEEAKRLEKQLNDPEE
jgi:hypothetical protein